MKRFFKIPLIMTLTLTVFAFSIYCCCFNDVAHAKPQQPACHQTAHQKEAPKPHTCDCHKNILANDAKPVLIGNPFHVVLPSIDQPISQLEPAAVLAFADAPESPPGISASIPLYIRHSVLRI